MQVASWVRRRAQEDAQKGTRRSRWPNSWRSHISDSVKKNDETAPTIANRTELDTQTHVNWGKVLESQGKFNSEWLKPQR